MKTHVVTQISIAASATEVFEYLTNLKYHYLWNPQIQSISSTKSLSLGEKYQTSSKVLGVKIRSKNVVTKFEKLRELQIENHTGLVQYAANFRLRPQKQGILLICTTTVSSDSEAFAFTKPVLKILARRELQADMQALKIAVEYHLK